MQIDDASLDGMRRVGDPEADRLVGLVFEHLCACGSAWDTQPGHSI